MKKFIVNIKPLRIDENEALNDLRNTYSKAVNENCKFSKRFYNEYGKYSAETISSKFSSWNNALLIAGIPITEEKNISDGKLFANIKNVWIFYGRQPTFREINMKPSKYSSSTYQKRFGSFNNALLAFSNFINSTDENDDFDADESPIESMNLAQKSVKRKQITSRDISMKLRFSIFLRDGFRCQSCGRSPLTTPGVELHVDHIIPWSKGGETIESNLQTKCKECNLGKNNYFNK